MPYTYYIPLNEAGVDEETGEEGTVTVDRLVLTGTKKQRIKQWRKYIGVRCGTVDVHTANQVARDLGFDELVP